MLEHTTLDIRSPRRRATFLDLTPSDHLTCERLILINYSLASPARHLTLWYRHLSKTQLLELQLFLDLAQLAGTYIHTFGPRPLRRSCIQVQSATRSHLT